MADDPDPLNLLLHHVDHLKPPQWVSDAYEYSTDKTGKCFHCHERFIPFLQMGRISKHNCRLCGELVCRSCTSKVHLPAKFEKKAKEISRVCHACLLTALCRRVAAGETQKAVVLRVRQYAWGGEPSPPPGSEDGRLLPRIFWLPEWANVHDTAQCFKCALVTDKRHHCRLCGMLFCGECCDKLDGIPVRYDQKNKEGQQRVCDFCRFCKARGWRFPNEGESRARSTAGNYAIRTGGSGPLGYSADAPSSAPIVKVTAIAAPTGTHAGISSRAGASASSASSSSSGAPPRPPVRSSPPLNSVNTRAASCVTAPSLPSARPLSQCSVVSCSSRAEVGGLCSQHGVENSALPKNQPASFDVLVRFRWEDDVAADPSCSAWAQVQAVGHADLHAINLLLSELCPRLEPSSFQYVCKGRAVQKMHWRMFEARFVIPDILLKKLTPFDHAALSPYAGGATSSVRSSSVAPQASMLGPPRGMGPPGVPPRAGPMFAGTSSGRPSMAPSPADSRSASPNIREQLLAQSKPSRATGTGSPARSQGTSRAASPQPSPRVSPKQQSRSIGGPPPPPAGFSSTPPPMRSGPPPVPVSPGAPSFGSSSPPPFPSGGAHSAAASSSPVRRGPPSGPPPSSSLPPGRSGGWPTVRT